MRIVSALFLGMLSFAAAGGCSTEKAPPLTPASGKTLTQDDAVSALASARCDHEEKCKHVGPEKEYSSREHCMSKMSAKAREKLSDCKDGKIDDNDIRECIGAVESSTCGGAMDDLETTVACNDDMCD